MEDIYIGSKKQPRSNAGDIYITPRGGHHEPDYEPPVPNEPHKKEKSNKKKKKGFFKRLKSFVLAVLLIFAIITGVIYATFASVNYNETGHGENVFLDEDELMQSPAVKNILLIGVDRRNTNDSSRSDTMLMVSINTATRKIKLTSFMRDTYVYIPERKGNAKLNAACTWGGAQMVMDTIEYNFNVKIDHYMLVDFAMFEDIIENLGGIEVEVTEKEAKYMRDRVHLKNVVSGESVKLNGKEALWYCRIRELDSDFMRTKRQRKVVEAIIDKAKSTNPIKLYRLLSDVVTLIETDMSPATLTWLTMNGLLRYLHYDIEQGRVPAEDTWVSQTISGQSVLSVDLGENREYLEEFIYE